MIITNLRTNRIVNPLGFELAVPRVSWQVEETGARTQAAAQVQVAADEGFEQVLFDSGKTADADSLAFELALALDPGTRYYWRVRVWGDNGESAESPAAWFETAKMDQPWQAEWITPDWEDNTVHPLLRKGFRLPAAPVRARAYASGLGLYELEINGQRVSEERLTPYCNAYDRWIQYQTYDVTALLQAGENVVGAMLGNGWYKGRFGFEGLKDQLYGDRFALLCELVVDCADGSRVVVGTDGSWKATDGPVVSSSLYDGEVYDANREVAGWSSTGLDDSGWSGVRPIDIGFERVEARRSLPVLVKEQIKPAAVIHTPAGETVLDMGQNMVGWLRFEVDLPQGAEIFLQHGEVLQQGNFFNLNLRSAKAEYKFISAGKPAMVEPHFTFYGFRYVKIEGWPGDLAVDDFTGCVVYSDIDQTGSIETSSPLVNRLFLNTLWGQKGNFLDVPTDCPQRDERMGWTGDAQVFASTACYNMDVNAFFHKYTYDMWREQEKIGGNVPFVVPTLNLNGAGSSAWGDAATVVPWTVYLHYGDKAILKQQLESMRGWVDYIRKVDDESGGKRLWTVGFHFGDWLALDGDDPKSPMGGTPVDFISSAYYCYSAELTAKAARALGEQDIAAEYQKLADEVRAAIQAEYFTKTGRLAIDTQAGLVVSLYMDLVPPEHLQRVRDTLRAKLRKDKYHLRTGFVGTPYLCRVLSSNGSNDLAYRLLMNEDYPSWLYAVKLGATTIWERWNSLLPDGTISDLTMNSFNHYAYGSILEWVYRHAAGLNPVEENPGWRRARIAPQPDSRLDYVKASLNSATGRYESGWALAEDGRLSFHVVVPFNASAELRLPDANLEQVTVNGGDLSASGLGAVKDGADLVVELPAGQYNFSYQPGREYRRFYSSSVTVGELINNPQVWQVVTEVLPQFAEMNSDTIRAYVASATPREMVHSPMARLNPADLDRLDEKLKGIRMR